MRDSLPSPLLQPLGDSALLIRIADSLSDAANLRAIALARHLSADPPDGTVEIVPGLVSVMLRYAPGVDFRRLSAEVGLRLSSLPGEPEPSATIDVPIRYDGEDLASVASMLGLGAAEFIVRHAERLLRVLATGFAPGFVYCGFHPDDMVLPRREQVRPQVPAGTVIFAAGQTAIAATPIRTGWHVIGTTTFQNFDPLAMPPTRLAAGDMIRFVRA